MIKNISEPREIVQLLNRRQMCVGMYWYTHKCNNFIFKKTKKALKIYLCVLLYTLVFQALYFFHSI